MKLIWHIVLKDFRRLWLPLAVWLVLLLAQMALLVKAERLYEPNASDYEGIGYFAMTWRMIVIAIGFILAASLVMEDSLVASKAFWRTRPLGGMRLLAAKSLGALLMFCALPVLVLTPVWWWCGFSPREWAEAAWELAVIQGGFTVIAFALACITEKSGQFLLRMIGAMLLGPVLLGFILGGIGSNSAIGEGLRESRLGLAMGLFVLSVLLLIVHQFATRHTRRSFALMGLGMILLIGARRAWPWDISPIFFSSTWKSEDGLPAVKLTQKKTVVTSTPSPVARSQIKLSGISSNAPKNSYVWIRSARGYWLGQDGEWPAVRFFPENRSSRPPEKVLRQVAGSTAPAGSNDWALSGVESTERLALACGKALKFETRLQALLMRGRVLGELPLREGAEFRIGSSRTRVLSLRRAEGKILVTLEERDAWGKFAAGFYSKGGLPLTLDNNRWPAEDGFVIRNLTTGGEEVADVNDLGTLRINSVVVGHRIIALTPPTQVINGRAEEVPGWEEGVVIVKVRFEPDSEFTRTIVTDPCASAR